LHYFDGDADLRRLEEYVAEGNQVQFADRDFMAELTHWIRFDKREALASLDGLYSGCMGSPAVPRWIGEKVLRNTSAKTQSNSDSKLLRSSAGAFAIASQDDSRLSWINAGRVYQRLALEMTAINIRSAFLNQPNEVSSVRKQFQDGMKFGSSLPQLLLRVGYANPTPFSYRRNVSDVITKS
jgi:hypothetical protein